MPTQLPPALTDNYEMAPPGLGTCTYETVPEGYEPVDVAPPSTPPQSELHDYESIRLSQLYIAVTGEEQVDPVEPVGRDVTHPVGRGVAHPVLSITTSGQSSSEYEMMESVQCLEDTAAIPEYANMPTVLIAIARYTGSCFLYYCAFSFHTILGR